MKRFLLVVLCLLIAVAGWSVMASGATVPLTHVVDSVQDGRTLIPLPKQLTWTEGDFLLNDGVSLLVSNAPEHQDSQTIAELQEILAEAGVESKVVPAAELRDVKGAIIVGEAANNSLVEQLLPDSSEALPAEGYQLVVTPDYVVVAGADELGTYWGVQTLRQLVARKDDGFAIRGAKITDAPDFPVRSLHMYISSDVNFVQQPVVTRLMSRLKLNTLVLEVDGSKWESHPEIWTAGGASKDQMSQLAEAAERQHIEVIPLINLFGHMRWAFTGGNNLDIAASVTDPYAYDPTNPASYTFAEEILDEVIDLFHPRYVHIGHDEIGRKVPTGGKPFGKVFVEDITKLHDYLQEQGVGTMIWADEALKSDVFPYIDQLPKDVVMVFWNYGVYDDYPQISQLRDLGFQVQGAVWYDWDNIELLSRAALARDAEGVMGTTWAGFYPDLSTFYKDSRQYAAYVVDAEKAWNTNGRTVDDLPYDPGEVFRASLASQDLQPRDQGFAVDLSAAANINALDALGKISVTRTADGINVTRAAQTLIIYTPERGPTTRCNKWGVEATVENGIITKVGGNNSPIPQDGLVLSGNSAGSDWLLAHATVGDKVTIDGQKITLSGTEETETYQGLASVLEYGTHRLNGVLFDVLDPSDNQGHNAIGLRGSGEENADLPRSVQIPVERSASALWFLLSATKVVDPMTAVGTLKIRYADGTSVSNPLIYGLNVVAWDDVVNFNLRDRLALAAAGRHIYALEWDNRFPGKEVSSITFISTGAGTSPVVLAITGVE